MDLPDKLSRKGIFQPDEVKVIAEVVGHLATDRLEAREREDLALFVLRVYQENPVDGESLLDRCQIALGH
ncbi:hypothetical protein GB927_007675 [Shinella sp. CPCC 100929]|uniref:Uncharacterized protein n=1 Tax=Shinella lacus TaxID=2654216 RepID=A0ABT1R479_9HYPH|nr:hypothetical protein [Shinella lacus]MCQ4629906.1 hypothetical protein [Shinella lacus]